MSDTHLVFLPDPAAPHFFLWRRPSVSDGRGAAGLSRLEAAGDRRVARIVDGSLAVRNVEGTGIPLLAALPLLGTLGRDETDQAPASVAAWSFAAKLALELVARGRVVPQIHVRGGRAETRWHAALAHPEDAGRVSALAQALPPAAHAVPAAAGRDRRGRSQPRRPSGPRSGRPRSAETAVWAPSALLRAFLDMAADAIVRTAAAPRTAASPDDAAAWERRFAAALLAPSRTLGSAGFRERALARELAAWARPALGADADGLRTCLRLELPPAESLPSDGPEPSADGRFRLRYFLQAPDDPSLLIPAGDVWAAHGRTLRRLGRTFGDAQEQLLRGLGAAARLFPPIEGSLRDPRPAEAFLEPREAWTFLTDAAPSLNEAGFAILIPAEITPAGRRRLRLRMRVSGAAETAGVVGSAHGLDLRQLLAFRWEAVLGDERLSPADLEALAALKAPLVRWRGHWVAVQPAEIAEARRLLQSRGGRLPASDAVAAALAGPGRASLSSLPVEVAAEGGFARALERLRAGPAGSATAVPAALRGTLRPYQARGLSWLAAMAGLGLGGCLADDMGLGKTVQVLAFLLRRREAAPHDRRPALIVCPTSVVGNWEREVERFAPSLPVVRHYGPVRRRTADALEALPPGAVVLTTYALLRRDAHLLAAVDWGTAILDEAQHIKNAASRTARAARALRASHRFALTGTPVENRLAELWSILEYAAPGILGPLDAFVHRYALPIERYRDAEAAERLRRLVRPFVLRRVKTDPAVITDLPPKNEMHVVCSLTKEQATLYRAAVNDAMTAIQSADGMRRRGLVLALLTALKQICNHPAHYLREAGPMPGRSGKLARLVEMLEEAAAARESALVFTQFREMGERLVPHLRGSLPVEVDFLHGGVPLAARDRLVRRFQDEDGPPRILVLSLKAGGTGLNLTRASHVFHFDRWWNPAVEDQATDRAYRIGQTRTVSVYKFLTAGTVEEKIDRMLEGKRDLASRIVGAGEHWITELDDDALRELFALSPDAVVTADAGDADDAAPIRGVRGTASEARGARGGFASPRSRRSP